MSECNHYVGVIVENSFHCIELNGVETNRFAKSDNQERTPKLYVVLYGDDIVYVGVTIQSISKRMAGGFKAKGNHGYYGYKWKELSEVELLVWVFEGKEPDFAEAVEGELVFLIRRDTGRWPKYQMEIHFHPDATEEERRVAESILRELI
ncbi:MAG: hypothetical protein ACRKGH_05605 [Dehalogenimonas sp.]